jgi:hypothetical protein
MPLPDAGGLALLLGESAVRGAGRVRDDGAHVAEVGGDAARAWLSMTEKRFLAVRP